MIPTEKPGSPSDILMHYGKKGMRWGVTKSVDRVTGRKVPGPKTTGVDVLRRAHEIKVSERAARNRRVASGKGSTLDNTRVALRVSGHSLIKTKGDVNKAILNKAISEEQHLKRLKKGEATTQDILKQLGGMTMLNIHDLNKVHKKKYGGRF